MTMEVRLAEVFQQYARSPDAAQHSSSELEQRLQEILAACRAAWPGLDVPADRFVRSLAENLPEGGDLDSRLSRMHGPDLYLACGCAEGDPAALAAFDRGVLGQAAPALRRMGLSDSQIDEVVQVVRAKLLVADRREHRPSIASYAGHGALVGWVRTAARRTALSMRRGKDEQVGGAGGPDGAEQGPGLEGIPLSADVELEYIKRRYQVEFKQAVEDAIATLDAEQVKVLQFHYTDGLSIDRIGALLSVHRATAARWIHAAADTVRAETRRLLHERLGLSPSELDSLTQLVQSQLHLSLNLLVRTLEPG